MKYYLTLLLVLIIGVVLIALPDNNNRLFSFSGAHGPSIVDFIGIIMATIAWLAMLIRFISTHLDKLKRYSNTIPFKYGLLSFGVGLGLVIASVFSDYVYWWAIGVMLLALLQGALFVTMVRK